MRVNDWVVHDQGDKPDNRREATSADRVIDVGEVRVLLSNDRASVLVDFIEESPFDCPPVLVPQVRVDLTRVCTRTKDFGYAAFFTKAQRLSNLPRSNPTR